MAIVYVKLGNCLIYKAVEVGINDEVLNKKVKFFIRRDLMVFIVEDKLNMVASGEFTFFEIQSNQHCLKVMLVKIFQPNLDIVCHVGIQWAFYFVVDCWNWVLTFLEFANIFAKALVQSLDVTWF